MPATPLSRSSRFYRPETTQFVWVDEADDIADIQDPQRGELDAGTEFSGEVSEASGFQVTSETLDVPDFGSRFVGKIGGATTADDSALTCYMNLDSSAGTDIRSELSRGDRGKLCIYDSGDVADNLMDIYPAVVTAIGKMRTASDPAQVEVQFAVTAEPAEDVVVPAHV